MAGHRTSRSRRAFMSGLGAFDAYVDTMGGLMAFGCEAAGGGRMADGFTVDRAALRETAQGINDTIGALEKLGFNEEAEVGRGFSGLALSGLQVGDEGLQSAFAGFCDRWSWGVRTLVQDGNQIAQRLGLTAGMYSDAEQSVIASLKDAVDAAVGDPYMSDAQAGQGSWAHAAGLTPGQQPNDFSAGAWKQAGGQIERTWQAEGHDVTHTARADLNDLTNP